MTTMTLARAEQLTDALQASDNPAAKEVFDVVEALRKELVRAHGNLDIAKRELAEANNRLVTAQNTAHNLQKSLNALWDKPAQLRRDVVALLERIDDVLPVNNLREHEDIEKMLATLEAASAR